MANISGCFSFMTVRVLDITKLYEAEHGRLRSFVRRIVGNPTTAEDVVQQAFANILDRLDDNTPNSAYVARAVRNLALNHLRDARRRADIEISDADLSEVADLRPTPETVALYRSELRHLLEVVAALPPRRREAFVFNKIEGLSYDDVAERMGISRNTVITLVVTAMAELDRRI
ncbi:RNA polymerase sigma factor [Shinella sp. BYT-45]|uniref:RNA polymerase sigma factor n=1 Tax=Shinella sp. BYT-45 TaxID=3377377 RepID=UPI00397F7098